MSDNSSSGSREAPSRFSSESGSSTWHMPTFPPLYPSDDGSSVIWSLYPYVDKDIMQYIHIYIYRKRIRKHTYIYICIYIFYIYMYMYVYIYTSIMVMDYQRIFVEPPPNGRRQQSPIPKPQSPKTAPTITPNSGAHTRSQEYQSHRAWGRSNGVSPSLHACSLAQQLLGRQLLRDLPLHADIPEALQHLDPLRPWGLKAPSISTTMNRLL